MTKRDNRRDETPIVWAIPGFKKGSRAPIPINQPHWVYGSIWSTKPTIIGIGFSLIFGLLLLSLIGSVFLQLFKHSQDWFVKPLLILVFGMGIYGWILFVLQQIVLYKRHLDPDVSDKNKLRKRKKHPKRRKDYQ